MYLDNSYVASDLISFDNKARNSINTSLFTVSLEIELKANPLVQIPLISETLF